MIGWICSVCGKGISTRVIPDACFRCGTIGGKGKTVWLVFTTRPWGIRVEVKEEPGSRDDSDTAVD